MLAAALLLAGLSGRAAGQGFSDKAVERAISRGMRFLWSKQHGDGSWESRKDVGSHGPYTAGPTALCTYALLEGGVRPSDKRMARALAYLEKTKADRTYCLAFRCLAYAAALKHDVKYKRLLQADVRQLLRSVDRFGGYTYAARGSAPQKGDYGSFSGHAADQSNTQYGLLGVWAGRMHNLEVPRGFWDLSLKYWAKWQHRDGGWGYSPKGKKGPYMAMTLAGLASVYVCYDNLYASSFLTCRGNARFPAAEKAVTWIEKRFGDIDRAGEHYYYTLYGVERVGLATGLKYFGRNDWYKRGATSAGSRQAARGNPGAATAAGTTPPRATRCCFFSGAAGRCCSTA